MVCGVPWAQAEDCRSNGPLLALGEAPPPGRATPSPTSGWASAMTHVSVQRMFFLFLKLYLSKIPVIGIKVDVYSEISKFKLQIWLQLELKVRKEREMCKMRVQACAMQKSPVNV